MFHIDVVEQCKANDRKAQMQLYKQYCEGMFCVAMRYVQDTNDAEDVIQEAFIKAFQMIHQFKGEVTFGAWLKRIVINKSIDFLKTKKQHLVALDENCLKITDDNDWKVDDGTTIDCVKSAISKLPDKYRFVVMMFLIEGYDHREIAQVLKLKETTSRTRLLRGKSYLRELLKERIYGTGS
ncbi:MAG: RNA polymerase subunit sigma-70 [Maribacter sp.]|nr:MAG: RNA polymerase subunit sigma-70 [Maribacter sp.]